jgi:hypothetical protein
MPLSIAVRQNVKRVLRSLRFIAKVRQGLSFNLHCFIEKNKRSSYQIYLKLTIHLDIWVNEMKVNFASEKEMGPVGYKCNF